jgi:hypothetical protein
VSGRSPVQRSPNKFGLSQYDRETSKPGAPGPLEDGTGVSVWPQKRKGANFNTNTMFNKVNVFAIRLVSPCFVTSCDLVEIYKRFPVTS